MTRSVPAIRPHGSAETSGIAAPSAGTPTRVLVIAPPDPLPSGRLRIAQYTELLEPMGYAFAFAPVENVRPTARELTRIAHGIRTADVVFVQRIASPALAMILRAARKPVVYDLDDAIHFIRASQTIAAEHPSSASDRARVRYRERVRGSRYFSRQKRPVGRMVGLADAVVVGNEYLHNELAGDHPRVWVLPTCVFVPDAMKVQRAEVPTRIGWIGVRSNLYELQMLEPVFRELTRRHGDDVILTVISSEAYETTSIRIEFVEWSLETEADAVMQFDIGIMPVHDNLHARGKCSFKAIQCMSYGIPVVISPVGMNAELLARGGNGYLANSTEEWFQALDALVCDTSLRATIGREAHATIEESYSSARAVATLATVLDTVRARRAAA